MDNYDQNHRIKQIILKTEAGDIDLFFYLETLEKRIKSLEEQVRNINFPDEKANTE